MLSKLLKKKRTAVVVDSVEEPTTEPVIIADEVIEKSSLFNAEWYSKTYNIKKDEAVQHYLHTGWRLGYDPSPYFSTEIYLKSNPDIKDYNPLLHFELYGKNENRLFQLPNNVCWFSETMQYYLSEAKYDYKKYLNAVIVIPVHEYNTKIKNNLKSVLRNTDSRHKIIIISNAVTISEMQKELGLFEENIECKSSDKGNRLENLSEINNVLEQIETEFAILLSPFAKVTEDWCEKMLAPYTRREKIASTAPFTNYDSIFYFPDNKNPELFEKLMYSDICESPYSIPVCMSINMEAWRKIGGFDSNLEDGIGQCMDWCFRASMNKYSHWLVPNLFVHYNDYMTSEEQGKSKKFKEAQRKLQEKYPDIIKETCFKFAQKDVWKNYRFLAGLAMAEKKLLLMIDIDANQNEHSGALYYSKKKVGEFEEEGFYVVSLKYKSKTNDWTISNNTISTNAQLRLKSLYELNLLFANVKVDTVFINNLAFNTTPEKVIEQISMFKDLYHFKMIYVFHDHLCVCPSYFLLDADSRPCNIPENMEICNACLNSPNVNQPIRRTDLTAWRRSFYDLFIRVDEFIFFSNYTKKLVTRVYPIAEKGKVIYHNATLSERAEKYTKPRNVESVTVGFVGRYDVPKGSEYFEQVINLLKKEYKVTPVIIGPASDNVAFESTGYYDKNELGKILTEKKVNFVIFPSISHETFSYVVQELMVLEVPVVSFRCGGHAERIADYPFGELTNETSLEALYTASVKMIEKLGLSECKIL